MNRIDYEWRYFIGGDMALDRRKHGDRLAYIRHFVQDRYEALLSRGRFGEKEPWSIGVYCNPDEAQQAVEKALEDRWEK